MQSFAVVRREVELQVFGAIDSQTSIQMHEPNENVRCRPIAGIDVHILIAKIKKRP
jgi:hypothetical protein